MRNIPRRNYFIMIGLIVLAICASFASYNIYNIYQNKLVSKSPLEEINQIDYEDLKNATKELNADTILIVSYVNDKKVYDAEKSIKKVLKKENLLDNMMYLNITECKDDKNFLKDLNKILKLKDKMEIKKYPAIVYYENGTPITTIDSSNHLINSGDIDHLLDMYKNIAS